MKIFADQNSENRQNGVRRPCMAKTGHSEGSSGKEWQIKVQDVGEIMKVMYV